MKKTKKRLLLHTFPIFLIFAVFLILFISPNKNYEKKEQSASVHLITDEAEKIVIASSDGSEYSLLFSSDSLQADQTLASEIVTKVKELYGITMRYKVDTATTPMEKEILIGNTNRLESNTLLDSINELADDGNDLIWSYAFINDKLLFTANSAKAFTYGSKEFINYLVENDFTVSSNLFVINSISSEEYDQWVEAEEEAKRQEMINDLISKNNTFTQEQFGGEPGHMDTTRYDSPILYPAEGEHPRLFITEDKIDDVLEVMADPAFESIVDQFWKEVEKEGCVDGFPIVNYSDPKNYYSNEYGEDWYRYDERIISALQNKAFAYLITGNELYGYEAIVGAKNMILTLAYSTYLHTDMYHGPSHVMIAVAKIYDWCYDLMTEDDKNQIIAGVSNILGPKMEMKFPPTSMSAVSGHGTGPQFLRDWFMCAIAFYDEVPDWWDLVGGRYFQEYVPVINNSTKNGWVSQGTMFYGPSKLYDTIISFRLIYLSTGEYSYDPEGILQTAYYLVSHRQPNGLNFQTGDGVRTPSGTGTDISYLYDIAATFSAPMLTAYLYSETENMTKAVDATWAMDFPAAKVLAYLAYLPEPADDFYGSIATVQYFEHPAGTMTARNSWKNEDAVAVYMRMGTMTMANHDICDSGTFQIYYKGLLAATSGNYAKYGANSHKYYLQSTVGHNGILVVNPDLASDNTWYSGGQRLRNEAGSLENWLGGDYKMGEITGYSSGYSYEDGTAEYGYIAGNITSAYDAVSVSYLERRMLTVFTGDENYPALFFTFDSIESTEAIFAKTYLLHTVSEPTVDTEKMTVDIRQDGGRLFVQNLFGANSVEKIGGEGKAFWINGYYNRDGVYIDGKNCVDEYTSDSYETIWGRAQFHAGGDEKETQMLTAMFVTDATNEETPLFEKFDSDSVYGAKWKDIYAVFLKSRDRQYKEFTFETSGIGLSKYYISGIETGTWKVFVDDIPVATVDVAEDGGFASFFAPSGKVTLKPTSNVIGGNGGRISYSTSGGLLGDDIPYTYNNEYDFPLSNNITRGEDPFLGWYTTPTFENDSKITYIPAGTTGTVTLYARWLTTYINEDYSSTVINNKQSYTIANSITYNGEGKAGSSYITKTDEDGINYLEWIEGTSDPIIAVTSEFVGTDLASASPPDETLSFEFVIAKNGDDPLLPFAYQLSSNIDYLTGANGVWGDLTIFSTTADGTVRFGYSGPIIANLNNGEIFKIRIAVDFANLTLTAYDEIGDEIQSTKFAVPASSHAPNGIEWRKLIKKYLAYIYASGDADLGASIKIYKHKIAEGNIFINKERTINYTTNGGTLAAGSPYYYKFGEATPLPDAYKDGTSFMGWYTTPTFDEGTLITEIPEGTSGEFNVYAKWRETFVNEDYTDTSVDITEADETVNGITYNAESKPLASFKIMTASNLDRYLAWTTGVSDSAVIVNNTLNNISTMTDGSISYTLTLSKNGVAKLPELAFTVIGRNNASGETVSDFEIYLGKLSEDGIFTIGSSDTIIATVAATPTTLRIVLDFEEGAVKAYNKWGILLASVPMPDVPEERGAETHLEWKECFTENLLSVNVTNSSSENAYNSLRIFGIKIEESNVFAPPDGTDPTVPECNEHYDNDKDGNCDFCEIPIEICKEHKDKNADDLCDICGEKTHESDIIVDIGNGIWGN